MAQTTPLVKKDPDRKDTQGTIQTEVSHATINRRALMKRSRGGSSLGTPLLPDLSDVACWVHILVFFGTMVPAITTMILTSDVTRVGANDWLYLHELTCWFRMEFEMEGYLFFLALAGVELVIAWFLDLPHWKVKILQVMFGSLMTITIVLGTICYAEFAPSMLLLLGVSLSLGVIISLRYTVLKGPNSEQFNFVVSLNFFLISIFLCLIWVLWAFAPVLGYHVAVTNILDNQQMDATHDIGAQKNLKLMNVMLWASPAILAITYFILGLFIFKRGQFHVPEGNVHVLTGMDGCDSQDNIYVGQELKFIFYVFVLVGLASWVAASVAAEGMELSRTVLRISGFIFTAICIYLWKTIGTDRIVRAAQEHPSVQYMMDMMTSDWMKAVFLAILWPVIPVYFVMDFMHQRVRRCFGGCCLDFDPLKGWLTIEGGQRWDELANWDWGPVLSKSITVGMIYYIMQVGATIGTTIFLSWLAELMASWNIVLICVILFLVGLGLFLIPVVPGLPIYLVAGIVVVQRMGPEEHFWLGIAVASLLCWFIKLASNIVLMKFGSCQADNVDVKLIVGTHTPTMRAAELILTQRGLTMPKVAVLIGGPDWPTAVLCAMLKVTVCSMLVGICPVLVLIIPVVMAAAYMLKQASAGDEDLAEYYGQLSTNMMLLSAVVQMGSMVVAGMYLHAVKVEHAEELEKPRKEDQPVIDEAERKEAEAKEFRRRTTWSKMPGFVKVTLFIGSFFVCGMMHIVLFFSNDAFQEYALTDTICGKLDCNPLNIFKGCGWIANINLAIAIIAQTIHGCWCKRAAAEELT